jgi:hypothetical protein
LLGICAAIGICYFYQTISAHWEKHLLLGLAALLLFIGIQYELRGIQQLQTTKKDLLAYDHVLSTTPQPIVTDLYWLPAALATRFIHREIYTLADRTDFPTWLSLARSQADSFLFVSLTPVEADSPNLRAYPLILVEERVVNGLVFAKFKLSKPKIRPSTVQ